MGGEALLTPHARPPGRRRFANDELVPLLGLAGFGYSLPLLDLLGSNPEFLVAHHVTGAPLALSALIVSLLPPLVAVLSVVGARALSVRVGRGVWIGWIVLFGVMAGASVIRPMHLSSDLLAVLGAVIGGVAILVAVVRWRGVRLGLSFLAVTPVFAVVALIGWSRAAPLVWEDEIGAAPGVRVGEPAPVVILQLDELPLASLLRADGSINEERFPSFARLAGSSTWFANAFSVAPSTTAGVPAAVTGNLPDTDLLPTADDHPANLFTLLGNSHELVVDEPVTTMCPVSLCGRGTDWSGLAHDAIGVAGQLWLPPALRERLPEGVQSAAGFEQVDALGGDTAGARQDNARAHIDSVHGGGDRPLLWYQHMVLPHVPWTLTATGRSYEANGDFVYGPTEAGTWNDDPALARLGLARHLLQVGAVDRMLGRLLDRLEAAGIWDDAFVAVLADHGAAFDPTEPYREPTTATVDEVYRIPLFVKFPGVHESSTRLDLAYNVDLLPTIIEALDIDVGWSMDGSALDEPVADRDQEVALFAADTGDALHRPVDFADVVALAARNAGLLPTGDDWTAVAAGGPLGSHVGAPVTDLEVTGAADITYALEQDDALRTVDTDRTDLVPVLVWATVTGPDAPTDLLLALNGTVAGTLTRLAGGRTYAGIVDEALVAQGDNRVEVFAPVDAAGTAFTTVSAANP